MNIWTIAIPCALSVAAVRFESLLLGVCFFLSIFAVLKLTPLYKGYENIWGFIIVAVSFIPINIYAIKAILQYAGDDAIMNLHTLLMRLLTYFILLCVEEVAVGVIIRAIWRRQRGIFE